MTELILPRKRWDEERDEVMFPNSTVFSHYYTYYRHDPVVTDLCWILGFKMRNGFLPEEHPYWFQGETDKTYRPDKGVCPAYKVWNFGDTKNYEVETGKEEYPQSLVDKKLNNELEQLFKNGCMVETGKHYTFNGTEDGSKFKPKQYQEYVCDGQKYIRVIARPPEKTENGIYYRDANYGYRGWMIAREINPGDVCWIKVEPIKWVFRENWTRGESSGDAYVSKAVLVPGIPPEFVKTYLKEYLSKEIEPSQIGPKQKEKAAKVAEELARRRARKKKQSVKKAKGLRKILDLARRAEILDKKTAAIRQRRGKLLENAVKGVTNPKERADILRRTNVQDIRNEESRARARVTKKILEEKYGRKK